MTLAIDYGDLLNKFLHFIVVGGFGFGVDLALTYSLLQFGKIHKYVANSIGFISGVTFNFFLNKRWTFADTDPHIVEQYIKFASIGIIGLLLVNSIIHFLHSRHGYPFYPSKVFAMFIFMFWNFTANYFYTFA